MREFATKADNIGDTLGATGFNAYIAELENIAKNAGFTLDSEAGPDTDLNMLGKSNAVYSSSAWRYADSGAADAYALSRVASSNLQNIPEYYDGVGICFVIGNTNTGASTVNVATLGAKDLFLNGSALAGGELTAGQEVLAFYSAANDRFDIHVPTSHHSATGNGFQVLPSGIIVQWGTATTLGSGQVTVNLPIAFPNASFMLLVSGNAPAGSVLTSGGSFVSLSQIQVSTKTDAGAFSTEPVSWLAIGN